MLQVMRSTKTALLVAFLLGLTQLGYSQRGKDGNGNIATTNNIINTYTYLTANAVAGATSITVNNNAMLGGVFGGALAPGDFILVIQNQRTTINKYNTFISIC